MSPFPRDKSLDNSLALLSEGYNFITNRCRRYHTDVFETRLMLRHAICVVGEDAARMFYHPGRFTRTGAMPPTTLLLLQDVGSVQTLDGAAHHHRKQMFMSLMNSASLDAIAETFAGTWRGQMAQWQRMGKVKLHDTVQEVLCRAACAWAGVPLAEDEARQRTREFAAMIEGAGKVGPRNWSAILLRTRTERWVRNLIDQVRARKLNAPEGSALHTIAWHRDPAGELLDRKIAAVELINILRPTVAVGRFITFAALALHEHPESRTRLAGGDEEYLTRFVQEVRRFYPFFPLIGGRVREEFEWREHRFALGTWVLLDMYGTNHDPRIWQEPHLFQPDRFLTWDGSAFNFIPQGGGDHNTDHRCPGEWITIELLKAAVRLLTQAMRYDVPPQDLRVNLSKMPALPESGFVIERVETL